MKPSRWACVGAISWLLLAGGGAYVTTEVLKPELPQPRKDKIHELFGQAGGFGFVGLLFVAGGLYSKDR